MNIERKTIDRWIESARAAGILAGGEFEAAAVAAANAAAAGLLYTASVKRREGAVFALLKMPGLSRIGPAYSWDRVLGIFGRSEAFAGFEGEAVQLGGGSDALFAGLSHANAAGLRRALPFTAPSPLADRAITFGTGDRLGVAGPGHLRSMSGCEACPVLAQQSVRELELTGRDYRQVLDAATWAVFQEGYEQPWGADGDLSLIHI